MGITLWADPGCRSILGPIPRGAQLLVLATRSTFAPDDASALAACFRDALTVLVVGRSGAQGPIVVGYAELLPTDVEVTVPAQ
jgi:hypothetical protein